MLDAESSGIRPTGSNARVRPQPSHLQSFSPVRLFSDTVLKPSPPEGVRGPCRCCDRESAEPPFPSKFQAFSPFLRPKYRPGAPCTGLSGNFRCPSTHFRKKTSFSRKKRLSRSDVSAACAPGPEALHHTRRQSRTRPKAASWKPARRSQNRFDRFQTAPGLQKCRCRRRRAHRRNTYSRSRHAVFLPGF